MFRDIRQSGKISALVLLAVHLFCCTHTVAGAIYDEGYQPSSVARIRRNPATEPFRAFPPSRVFLRDKASDRAISPAAAPLLPVPADADQMASRKRMVELFDLDIKDRVPAGRRALATRFFSDADKMLDQPQDKFVLLVAARDAAAEGGDLRSAFKAVDALAEKFDIDAVDLKAQAAMKTAMRAGGSVSSADEDCNAALELIDPLVAADSYAAASRLLAMMKGVPTDSALTVKIGRRASEVDAIHAEYDRIARDLEHRGDAPLDPALKLVVARFLCFVKGDWSRGLPALASTESSALQFIAKRDLADTSDPEVQATIGDGWWDAAAHEKNALAKDRMTDRATAWYERARGRLRGLAKAKVDQRLTDARAAKVLQDNPNWVDLLGGSRLLTSTGAAQRTPGGVRLGPMDDSAILTAKPVPVPFHARIVAQTDSTNIRLGYGQSYVILNWEGNEDELRFADLAGTVKGFADQGRVPKSEWVTIDLVYGKDYAEVSVDDHPRGRISGDFSKAREVLSIKNAASSVVTVKTFLVAPGVP